MRLYHGTNYASAINICSNGIDLSQSKMYLDFGPGFYATPSYDYAVRTAIRTTDKINRRNQMKQKSYKYEEPYVVQFEYIPSGDLKIKTFPRHGAEWGAFVLNNRLYPEILSQYHVEAHNKDCKYDVCIGEIADGSIANIAYQVNTGELLLENVDYKKFLKKDNMPYGQQYSFHSDKSISCIISLTCDIIKNKERYMKL